MSAVPAGRRRDAWAGRRRHRPAVHPPSRRVPARAPAAGTKAAGTKAPPGSRGIDELLGEARSRLARLDPEQAHLAYRQGAILVDIRPQLQRVIEGEIPGALLVERNVLEWRFDPRSEARLPVADRYDLPVVVFCSEGYTSSLAAAALQDLGLHRATDVDGGFRAWRAVGLPIFAGLT